jgi:hypothetical protein
MPPRGSSAWSSDHFRGIRPDGFREGTMVKQTKFCELTVYLRGGDRLTGRLHVEGSTSSTVRPSDAIRQVQGNFLLLTDVTVQGESAGEKAAILVPTSAVNYIEVHSKSWTS